MDLMILFLEEAEVELKMEKHVQELVVKNKKQSNILIKWRKKKRSIGFFVNISFIIHFLGIHVKMRLEIFSLGCVK